MQALRADQTAAGAQAADHGGMGNTWQCQGQGLEQGNEDSSMLL